MLWRLLLYNGCMRPIDIDVALVRGIFDETIRLFLKNDTKLIKTQTNERTYCGRMSTYMQNIAQECGLEGYFADVEYNRNMGRIKQTIQPDGSIQSINCDLLLHSRGIKPRDNLIAVEVKKKGANDEAMKDDRKRLQALTKRCDSDNNPSPTYVCGYLLGIFVIVESRECKCHCEFYENGEKTGECTYPEG